MSKLKANDPRLGEALFPKEVRSFFGSDDPIPNILDGFKDKPKSKIEKTKYGASVKRRKARVEKTNITDLPEGALPKARAVDTLGTSLAMLGVTAGLSSMLMGGMMNMFGSADIKPRELVTAMIDGFMVYIDEWREKVKEKEKEIENLECQLEQKKQHYEDALEMAKCNQQEAEKYKKLYMQQVSKARAKKSKKKK